MMTKPPDDYLFAFTLDQLFSMTERLTQCRQLIDQEISLAFAQHREDDQRILTAEREDLTDIIDMLTVPIDIEANALRLAQQGIYEDDDGGADNDNWLSDWDSDDYKDAYYKN